MKLKSVKSEKEIVLKGIDVAVESIDGTIQSLHLKDADGNILVIARRDYAMTVSVKAPPEMKKVHQITGEIAGIKIKEIVEDGEWQAKDKFSKLELAGANNLILNEVSVEVN